MKENRSSFDSLTRYRKDIEDVFTYYEDHLKKVRDIAVGISADMESLSSFIQRHTAAVCPECTSVCCINRHSYHTFDDIIYLCATGEKLPLHEAGIDDSAPCHFLGNLGCTLPRSIRPYRCNWYFCSSLLDHIVEYNSTRQYRSFISLLQQITGKRQTMIEEYASATKKTAAPHMHKPDNFLYY